MSGTGEKETDGRTWTDIRDTERASARARTREREIEKKEK